MSTAEVQNNGLQNNAENLVTPESLKRHEANQGNTMQRAELAHRMGADTLRNTAVGEIVEREESRTAEQVRTELNGVLSQERIASLNPQGVRLWQTGGHARIETNNGFVESSGDNEQKRVPEILQRIRRTAKWGMKPLKGKETYAGLSGNELIIDMPLLKDDLAYVSDAKRTEAMIPEGDNEKAEQFKKRAEFFAKYRETLKEILDTVHPPQSKKGRFFSAKYGGIAEREQIQRYCTDPENLKGSLQVIAMMGLGVLFAINAINDMRQGKIRVMTLLMLGGIVALAGKDSKFNILTNSKFAKFSKNRLTRKKAEMLMSLKGGQKNALLKKFSSLQGETITKENMRSITHPKKQGKEREDRKLVEVVEIFDGMNSSLAHNILSGLSGMSKDKNRNTGLDFIEALEQDPGTTENLLADVKANPNAVAQIQ
ncbi:hypothetical protein COU75_02305 [Candidatus Peregrinibacteria bacterium CG10_big_fil_rev_8_21_14_0_10_42_8]|nr:MAG: hypothetical protein COU75_02305 [Candidatus Peregrinibacteria bacterium CG10_big_fil_rev_8_21_14_0_10_42_8]